MATLVERYKNDYDEVSTELDNAKNHFRDALLESEETIFQLKDKVNYLETELKKVEKDYQNVKEELNITTKSFAAATKGLEDRIECLQEDGDQCSETSSVNNILSAFESEKARLKNRISNLESLKNNNKKLRENLQSKIQRDGVSTSSNSSSNISSTDSNNSIFEELSKCKETIRSQELLIEKYKSSAAEISRLEEALQSSASILESRETELEDLTNTLSEMESENADLKKTIEELTISLDACKKELVRVSNDLDDATTRANSVETYERDIETLRDELDEARAALEYSERTRESNTSTLGDCSESNSKSEANTIESDGTGKLDNEITNLKTMIEQQKLNYETQKQSSVVEDTAQDSNADEISIEEQSVECDTELLTQMIKESRTEISEEKSMIQDSEQQVVQLSERISELEATLSELSREKREAIGQVAELQVEKSILSERIKDFEHLLQEEKLRLSQTITRTRRIQT